MQAEWSLRLSFHPYSELLFDACASCLGEKAEFCQKEGQSFLLSGVFTKEYQLIREGSIDTVVSSSAPVFEVSSKACPAKVGDRLKIRGELYRVVEIQPNGEGQTKLVLKKGEKL